MSWVDWLNAFALLGTAAAIGTTLLAGMAWLQAAREQKTWGEAARRAAILTGYAMIIGALSITILAVDLLPRA